MNKYIKIDKREIIFDFLVKSVIERNGPQKCYILNYIRIC